MNQVNAFEPGDLRFHCKLLRANATRKSLENGIVANIICGQNVDECTNIRSS